MIEIPSDVDLLEILQHETLVRYFIAAGGALFAYDVLINLDIELRYIWAALDPRKRPIKRASAAFNLMYLAQRYLPLLDQVILDQYILLGAFTPRECAIGYSLSAWCSVMGILLSELILGIRIWGVWARKPSIGVILVVFALGCSIPAMIFFERFLRGIQYPDVNAPVQILRCLTLMRNKDVYVCWIVLMIYDGAGFILMAIPGFTAYRIGGSSNLVKVVYRDGIIYYALIFMVSTINVVIILVLSPDLVIVISPFERVLHSILASRAILHIRKVALEDNIQTASGGMLTTLEQDTEMAFVSNMFRSTAESED